MNSDVYITEEKHIFLRGAPALLAESKSVFLSKELQVHACAEKGESYTNLELCLDIVHIQTIA